MTEAVRRRRRPVVAVVSAVFLAALAVHGAAGAQQAEAERPDHLDLLQGAVVRTYSSQASDETYAATTAIDGTPATGWSTERGATFPHALVIELARPIRLEQLAIDNTHPDEENFPGISAREFTLELSDAGPEGPWTEVLRGEAARGARSAHSLPTPTEGQWVRLSVLSNWGHAEYTEVMELEAYGEPLREAVPADLDGVFDTNYELLRFATFGSGVLGCYDWDNGTLMGFRNGRVTQFEWRENGGAQVGTAILALSEAGDFLNGLWYEGGRLRGYWFGDRVTDGREPDCQVRAADALGMALDENGRAVVYGIYFDFGSDRLRPDAEEPLQGLLAVLESRPGLRVLIEGHTDSVDSDEFNLDLSRRRAAAVVGWLTARGIGADRLASEGYGESRPVAGNDSAQGRALNRRVEVAVQR